MTEVMTMSPRNTQEGILSKVVRKDFSDTVVFHDEADLIILISQMRNLRIREVGQNHTLGKSVKPVFILALLKSKLLCVLNGSRHVEV